MGVCFAFLFFQVQMKNKNVEVPQVRENTSETQEMQSSSKREEKEVIHVFQISSTNTLAIFEYSKTPKHISEWTDEEEGIVINGAYFLEDFSPAGFLVVNNEKVGATLFDQDKSGLVVIENGKLSIRDLEMFPIQKTEKFEYAMQSFPFLIKNSKPAIASDSGKKAQRTAIGVDAKNNVYVLVVVDQQISLYEFMKEIQKLPISFTAVLNLDGGPSTGIYVNWNGEEFFSDSFTPVSSIVRWKKRF